MELAAIRSEASRAQAELDELDNQYRALDLKRSRKRKEVELLNGLLALRSEAPEDSSADERKPTERVVFHANSTENSDRGAYGAKTKHFREFVLSTNGSGLTMAELRAEAKRLGANEQFAYQFVNREVSADPPRMERRGDGRVYTTEHFRKYVESVLTGTSNTPVNVPGEEWTSNTHSSPVSA